MPKTLRGIIDRLCFFFKIFDHFWGLEMSREPKTGHERICPAIRKRKCLWKYAEKVFELILSNFIEKLFFPAFTNSSTLKVCFSFFLLPFLFEDEQFLNSFTFFSPFSFSFSLSLSLSLSLFPSFPFIWLSFFHIFFSKIFIFLFNVLDGMLLSFYPIYLGESHFGSF